MAFGRSNSLSLNTGATNSLFGQQNQSSQPPAAGSLFGNTQQQSGGGGLFGGQNQQSGAASNSTGGGLFGGSNQQSGGLFGASTQQSGQNQQGGGLFGASTQQSGQNQQSGGLFGGGNQQSGQTQQSGGLFGGSNQQTGQAQQTGGLFGNATSQNNTTQQNSWTSLFGAPNQSSNQQTAGSSLFGGLGNQNKPAGASLFGGSTAQQPAQNQQSSQFGTSVFDNNNSNVNNQSAWKLSMGQGAPQQQTVPGTKIDLSNIRPTTRFSDLHDDIKKSIEQIDNFIKSQEAFASQCEALIPNHSANIDSVTPDVELINNKVETVEISLENDSREIKAAKDLVNADAKDLTRCVRVIENQNLPSQYHYGPSAGSGASRNRLGDEDYDVDLVGYFTRQAESMQKTLETFTSNLAEIESHLRVIESSTVQQSQQVAAQRAGAVGGNAAVRELAETLRGFENGILNAAGYVGACREGVNELIMGKMDNRRRY